MKRRASPLIWFSHMVDHALRYAKAQKRLGRHIVGITCEYTPRELILAAGGIPVCLCGGDADMIPPAEQHLPANLCPLIKSTYGYSLTRENPFLEMAELLVTETTCDGKKKMYELMAENRPMHVMELPQKADDPDAMRHWVRELHKLREALEKRFRVRVTDSRLRGAIRLMNAERRLRRELAGLMRHPSPPLTGVELLSMKSLIAGIPADHAQYRRALVELPGRQLAPPAETRVRVLVTGVPIPHGAERVMELIESHDGLVVCQENCTGLKPILEDVDTDDANPIHALAEKYFHLPCSVITPNHRRFDSLRNLIAEYRPQCVVEIIWQACLTYDVESHHVRKLVEDSLGLPYLRVETDYSPSDSASIAMRLQALFETAKARS
jgi:benzoyl-CoA reductase/2-hydroxyglutaryl-CoA dehydratase subunit BcrC/BadD/HgdB